MGSALETGSHNTGLALSLGNYEQMPHFRPSQEDSSLFEFLFAFFF